MLSLPKIREIPVHHEITQDIVCALPELRARLGRAYGEIEHWAAEHRIRISAPFARYRSFSPASCNLEAGFIADRTAAANGRIQVRDNGGYTALIATHTGPFSTVSEAYRGMEEFMHIHGYVGAGAPVEYYLTPPDTPPEEQKTEIVWPVVPNEV